MSDEKPRQVIFAETGASEILDRMGLRFTGFPDPIQEGDSVAIKNEKGDWFHCLVIRPEGERDAFVSCNVPPLFWTLHGHIVHVERLAYEFRLEAHHLQLLEHVLGRKMSIAA